MATHYNEFNDNIKGAHSSASPLRSCCFWRNWRAFFGISRTPAAGNTTHHTSRITHHTSHITHHASHIKHHASHITHHASRITHICIKHVYHKSHHIQIRIINNHDFNIMIASTGIYVQSPLKSASLSSCSLKWAIMPLIHLGSNCQLLAKHGR